MADHDGKVGGRGVGDEGGEGGHVFLVKFFQGSGDGDFVVMSVRRALADAGEVLEAKGKMFLLVACRRGLEKGSDDGRVAAVGATVGQAEVSHGG